MKINKQVARVRVGLTAYELALLGRATEIMGGDNAQAADKIYLLRWALVAVCQAVIKRGEFISPLAVDIRKERPEETNARVLGVVAQAEKKIIPPFIAKIPAFLLLPDWQQNIEKAIAISRLERRGA